MAIAEAGDTTESIGGTMSGSSNRYASICHAIDTSSGSRVRRDGTTATSSNAYAARPRFPRPISSSATRFASYSGFAQGAAALSRALRAPGRRGALLVVATSQPLPCAKRLDRNLPARVVGRLGCHLDVVRVALPQPGGGDADELPIALEIADGRCAGVTHCRPQPSDELVGDGRKRAAVRRLAFDALRYQLVVG